MNIDRARDTASGGHAQGDQLNNIENLIGSAYDDTLTGNGSANILNGGAGDDELAGGSGADKFELVLDGSSDTIWDFSVSQGDKIRIDTNTGTEDSLQDLGFSIAGNSSAAKIVYQAETVLTLTGVSASDMLSGSFDTYFEVV